MVQYEWVEGELQLTETVDLAGINWKDEVDFRRRCAEASARIAEYKAAIKSANVVLFPGLRRDKGPKSTS